MTAQSDEGKLAEITFIKISKEIDIASSCLTAEEMELFTVLLIVRIWSHQLAPISVLEKTVPSLIYCRMLNVMIEAFSQEENRIDQVYREKIRQLG